MRTQRLGERTLLLRLIVLQYCTNKLKVTPDLRGCPRGKNSYARHSKGKHGKLYVVGKRNKCRFGEKYKLPVFSIPQKKITKIQENDHVSFN